MVEIESNQPETDPVEESRMTLGEHLDELRVRLLRATVAILVIFCVAWGFRHTLDRWSQRPYHLARLRLNPIIEQQAAEAVSEDPEGQTEYPAARGFIETGDRRPVPLGCPPQQLRERVTEGRHVLDYQL